jgi:hypothetical protein
MELRELLNGLNDMRTMCKDIHNAYSCKCTEVCDVQLNPTTTLNNCTIEFRTYKGLIELWTSILCLKPTLNEWDFKQCLMGDYNSCGVHTLKLCPFELEIDRTIHWRNIGYEVVGQIENGRGRKASQVEYIQASSLNT